MTKTLYKKLGELYELQEIDTEIIQSMRQVRCMEKAITPLQKRYKELSEKNDFLKRQVEPTLKEARQLQEEMVALNEKKKICEDKLFSPGTEAKELQYLQKEREQYVNLHKMKEDKVIKLMVQIDGSEIKRRDIEEHLKEIEADYKKEREETEAKIQELKNRVEQLKEERLAFRNFEDRNMLVMYREIQLENDGLSIATVLGNETDPKDPARFCSGCQVELARTTLSQLSEGDELVFCQECGRMLYSDEFKPGESDGREETADEEPEE